MEKKNVIETINHMGQICLNIVANDFQEIDKLIIIIDKLKEIIAPEVYIEYKEYFAKFNNFCINCKDRKYLEENREIMLSSVELFAECLDEIIKIYDNNARVCPCCNNEVFYGIDEDKKCPRCGSTSGDRIILEFLKKVGLENARERSRVLLTKNVDTIKYWIRNNCPQVLCEESTTELQMELNDIVICTDNNINELENKISEYKKILKKDGLLLIPYLEKDINNETQNVMNSFEKTFVVNHFEIDDYDKEIVERLGLCKADSVYILTSDENVLLDKSFELEVTDKTPTEGPLVSVVMSCYNHGKYVADTVESVINQTYKNIEFLVADDCSTDNSVEVLKGYSEYFTKELYFEENSGYRIYELFPHVKGKYIALINSDDVWEKDKIALQVEYLETHPDTGAVFTWAKYTDENLNILDNKDFIVMNKNRYEWMQHFWTYGNCLSHPSVLMRSEEYMQLQSEGTGCRQLYDFFMWVSLAQKKEIYVVPKILTKMRRHSNKYAENVSAINNVNIARNCMEEMIQWSMIIENMSLDLFKKAFHELFRNKNANDEIELMLEKFFLMFDSPKIWIQNDAFIYFGKIIKNDNVGKTLYAKYGLSISEIVELYATKGFGKVITEMI